MHYEGNLLGYLICTEYIRKNLLQNSNCGMNSGNPYAN